MSLAQTPTHLDYPFPEWYDGVKITIENAMKVAWTTIKSEPVVLSGNENDITFKLEDVLQSMMDSGERNGFDTKTFQTIVRGADFENYDGRHIEKQPDLVFRLIAFTPGMAPSRHDAIFVECKIIGDGRSIIDYIKHGVRRFVDGEYAWAMPHSMMIAYVRDRSSLPDSLKSSYDGNNNKPEINKSAPKNGAIKPCKISKTSPQTYITIHSRNWVHSEYGSPGDIKIRHMWLSAI